MLTVSVTARATVIVIWVKLASVMFMIDLQFPVNLSAQPGRNFRPDLAWDVLPLQTA
jgi:hypothetical protein